MPFPGIVGFRRLRRVVSEENRHTFNARAYDTRTFCGVLHQELERVKGDTDVDSLFLDKQFLSECVEDLDSCHDALIIDDVKKMVETKKRMRLERAKRVKKKYHKKIDSI